MDRHRNFSNFLAVFMALCTVAIPINGFNMDLEAPIVQRISALDSYFGFSVAMHRENGMNSILVGAPTFQTNDLNVNRSGALFSCPVTPLTGPPECLELTAFNNLGTDVNEAGDPVATRNHQWFGATVRSSGEDGIVVACRPLYTWYVRPEPPNVAPYKREPIGGCFVARNDFTDIEVYEPCRSGQSSEQSVFGVTHCQAGLAADITNDQILLGAPGSFFWQGQIWVSNADGTSRKRTNEGPLSFDDSYRGYAVGMGDFRGDSQPEFAVGIPRANRLLGMVSIYDATMNAYLNLTGTQVGAYYGHSLAISDFNDDGLNDIVVGAPFFIDEEKTRDGWEIGSVYIYYNDGNGGFSDGSSIVGFLVRGRFGSALAALSDVNQDGYNDLAVSAPYGGTDNAGAVYIYHGMGFRGISPTYSQVLEPSSFGLDITSFGFSLSAGLDMDGNMYPDLVVGAYKSAAVVLVRSRPIISVRAILSSTPSSISLKSPFNLGDGTLASASFNMSICITYTGSNVPSNVDIEYSLILDYNRPTTSRALFMLSGTDSPMTTKMVTLNTDVQACSMVPAYVKTTIRDKLSPIGVSLNFNLASNRTTSSEILPILDESVATYTSISVPIQRNCMNQTCVPNLGVVAGTNMEHIEVGSRASVSVNVTITNRGEDAYLSTLTASIPEEMQYVGFDRMQGDQIVTCTSQSSTMISCEVGNPFTAGSQLKFSIQFSSENMPGNRDSVLFNFRVSSVDTEDNDDDNEYNVTIPLFVTAELSLYGSSNPDKVIYAEKDFSVGRHIEYANQIGPEVSHIFSLYNNGPSSIGETIVTIPWPVKYDVDEYLLYPMGVTMDNGEECTIEGGWNPDSFLSNFTESYESDSRRRRSLDDTTTPANMARTGTPSSTMEPSIVHREISCSGDQAATCLDITCMVDTLGAGINAARNHIIITVRSRVWTDTVTQRKLELSVSIKAQAQVISVPYVTQLTQPIETISNEVAMSIAPDLLKPPVIHKEIPLWVFLVSALGGVIILIIIVVVLYALGFFKRKKITPEEKELIRSNTISKARTKHEEAMGEE